MVYRDVVATRRCISPNKKGASERSDFNQIEDNSALLRQRQLGPSIKITQIVFEDKRVVVEIAAEQ